VDRTLAIVERAHRGALEQQYAHVLWLAHALHRQSPMTVLLRGTAAVYALVTAPPPPLRVGGRPWGVRPDYTAALERLSADGARVLVCATSLADLGLADRPLHPVVRPLPAARLATFVATHRRVWFL
jgi:hypothetical protein